MARKSAALQEKLMQHRDERVSATNEAFTGIRLIKLSGWEGEFQRRIAALRDRELGRLLSFTYLSQIFDLVWTGLPLLVTLASFAVYTGIHGRPPTAAAMFTSLSLFSLLRFPMSMLPAVINSILEARVSLGRIAKFLAAEEVAPLPDAAATDAALCRAGEVRLTNARFVWSTAAAPDATPSSTAAPVAPFMKPITLHVTPGQMVAVVGLVGSGKSSLLSGLLGEMALAGGEAHMGGRVAYAPQTPFILNATVRENILFGGALDEARYQRVLTVTQLRPDLALLSAGDDTEIGGESPPCNATAVVPLAGPMPPPWLPPPLQSAV